MTTENKPNRWAIFIERLKHFSARDVVHGIETVWQRLVNLIEKARETYYRLVILDDETFKEVNSYKLSIFNFYVAVSTLFVGFTILGMALIVFTPLKKIIPGYGGYGSERAVFNLYERVDSMERVIKAHETYTNNFRKMLIADVETEKDVPKDKQPTPSVSDSIVNTDPSEFEMKIRAGGGDPFEESNSSQSSDKAIKVNLRNDRLESMFLQSPLAGSTSLPFSLEKKHYGIDITAPKNTAIKAVSDGFVILCDWTLETGNTIAIQHANNVVSFYKHNSSLLKKVGDKVKTGEAIAIIGNTGVHTTGPHLHFELWKDGKAVNPQEYIRF
ncbi:MAG: M23 family metallopeptidase [Saprospiraceae bacterium]|nr:M23 family metallopeptidase [Saprospiraceae bacterium]